MKLLSCFLLLGILYSGSASSQNDTSKRKEITTNFDYDTTLVFLKVEVPATVDPTLWRNHLETALFPPLQRAVNMGLKEGRYIVQVKFLVERDGSISDVTALNDPGYYLAMESVNIVKTGPKWNPGRQNGQKVRTYLTQPITFVVTK
jgi:protein TonB